MKVLLCSEYKFGGAEPITTEIAKSNSERHLRKIAEKHSTSCGLTSPIFIKTITRTGKKLNKLLAILPLTSYSSQFKI